MNNFANSYIKYVNHLEQINQAAKVEPEKLVTQIEQTYHRYLRLIELTIKEDIASNKIILLSGPSGSGKTTTAHLIRDYLEQDGVRCALISLDNFYMGESNAPIMADGRHDYETVDALDIPVLEQCLMDLMAKNECEMPIFDFEHRRPSGKTRHVQLEKDGVAIFEGIHALNPKISAHLPPDRLMKLYISVKQDIKDKHGVVLSHSDLRFVRRVVRDYKFRGTRPERTLDMWPNVLAGEGKYIQPYKSESDFTINSIHIYEPCVLRDIAIPLLRGVDPSRPEIGHVNSLIKCLERFVPIDHGIVPKNSIVREFMGGGLYE